MNEEEREYVVGFVKNLNEFATQDALIQLLLYGDEAREFIINAAQEFNRLYNLPGRK